MNKPTFQTLLQNYFLNRLIQQRKVSAQTVESYRDTFRIYLNFLRERHSVNAPSVAVEHFSREYVAEFCGYLEKRRSNKASTINNRLAAIRSFLKFVAEQCPEYSGTVKYSLMVPFQKEEKVTMDFITKDEFDVMIGLCDTSIPIGARDKLMLMLLYNTGIRVSELLSLKYTDIYSLDTPGSASVRIWGKGRKERTVPLWKTTARYITKYADSFGISGNDRLFVNKNGDNLTRSGIRSRIEKLTALAAEKAPTLLCKNVSAHTFRHSVAMNLLQAGIDISTIAIWLGHSSIETTHKYMVADIELKRAAMEKAGISGNSNYHYKPSKDILAFLNSL